MFDKIFENSIKTSETITLEPKVRQQEPIEKIQKENTELTDSELKLTKSLVKLMNELHGNKLEFGFNEEAKMGIIEIFERDNHKLIRQFPSKEFFTRLLFFRDNILPGLLMDEKV